MQNNKGNAAANTDKKVSKLVVMIVFDGVEILDVAGPASVFSKANEFAAGTYEFRVMGAIPNGLVVASGIALMSHGSWSSLKPDEIDTLIVAGGPLKAIQNELASGDLVAWLAKVAPQIRRVVSVCTGAFALGEAKLLDGCRSTTHWEALENLQTRFPLSKVEHDKIFVREGKIWTSAGILTGIDLALALVEDDLGKRCAIEIGKLLVIAGMRPGDSSQKSALLANQAQAGNKIRDLLSWIQTNVSEDLSIDVLVGRVQMSDRHFRRVFQAEMGMTPFQYVSAIRLNYAAELLRSTQWNIETISVRSGFSSVDTLQRGFIKRWNATPTSYREMHIYRDTAVKL